MTSALALVLLTLAAQDAKAAALPDTPQGRHVQAWVKAFNTGDEKAFLAIQEQHVAKTVLARRPDAERAKMFQRMRGDFPALRVTKVVRASETQIQFQAPANDGGLGTFTFDFEDKAPYLISSIGIDVR